MLLKNVTILFITDRLHRVKVESGSSKILRIRIRNSGGFLLKIIIFQRIF